MKMTSYDVTENYTFILAARVNALQQQAAAQMQQAAIQQAAAEIRNRAVSAKMREQWHLQQQLQNTAIMQEVLKQKAARPMMTPTPPTHPQLRSPHGKLNLFLVIHIDDRDGARSFADCHLHSINMKSKFKVFIFLFRSILFSNWDANKTDRSDACKTTWKSNDGKITFCSI